MKIMCEVNDRLMSELKQWFIKQFRDQYSDYYLYHLPSTPERDGGLLIAKDTPPNGNYQLSWNQPINKGATVEQNFRKFSEVCRRLPILTV